MNQNKIVFISWAPYCSRSDNIARELGGKSYMVYYESLGSNYYTIALKYLLQTVKTLMILFRDRPDTVFVMSPSLFANISVFIYSKIFGAQYIIDAHTGALENSMWKRALFLQKFFCRNALFTIVTNNALAKYIKEWGAEFKIISDVPIQYPINSVPKLSKRANVLFVNTFADDEPLSELLEATKQFNNVDFYISGKIDKFGRTFLKNIGENVIFTDFLSNDKFYGLMHSVDLVIALTKNDNTMQRGAYEAIYMGKPVITSDWKILRTNFNEGAVFVDNSVEGIIQGLEIAIEHCNQLTLEAESLKNLKISKWRVVKNEIIMMIGGAS